MVWSGEDEKEDLTFFQLINSHIYDGDEEGIPKFVKASFKSTSNYLLVKQKRASSSNTEEEETGFQGQLFLQPVMKHDPMLYANDTTADSAFIEGHFDRRSCIQGLVRGFASWWHDVETPQPLAGNTIIPIRPFVL